MNKGETNKYYLDIMGSTQCQENTIEDIVSVLLDEIDHQDVIKMIRLLTEGSAYKEITDTNLAGGHLQVANLSGANLEGANLEGANLEETEKEILQLIENIHECETKIKEKITVRLRYEKWKKESK